MSSFANAQYQYDNQLPPEPLPLISDDVEEAFDKKHGEVLNIVENVIQYLFDDRIISGGAYEALMDRYGNVNSEIDSMTEIYLNSVKEFITKAVHSNPPEHIDEPEDED